MAKQYELTLLIETKRPKAHVEKILDVLWELLELDGLVRVHATFFEDITETEGDNDGETVEDSQ